MKAKPRAGLRRGAVVSSRKLCVLTINGGSSSIKFALFRCGETLIRILEGRIEGVGLPEGSFTVTGSNPIDNFSRPVAVPEHAPAVTLLMDWIQQRTEREALSAVGHRVVHGGPTYWEPQRITPQMLMDPLRSGRSDSSLFSVT